MSCGRNRTADKVEYEEVEGYKNRRLVRTRADLNSVANINISKYKAKFYKQKVYEKDGEKYVSNYFKGKDEKGNDVLIEVAHKGHPSSSSGGIEPAHVKVKIDDASGKEVYSSKYFVQEDKYRLK